MGMATFTDDNDQVKEEDSKFGIARGEAREILQSEAYENMKNVRVIGLMGMAKFSSAICLISVIAAGSIPKPT